jgi:predicted metal-dependent hydrolase
VNIDKKSVNVHFTTSAKIKHCYLKIVNENSITIRANKHYSLHDAKALIAKKHQWIAKHIQALNLKKLSEHECYFLGKLYEKSHLLNPNESVELFYKKKALEIIPSLVQHHSNRMQLFPKALKFRKNKSRWGSCSVHNVINLNILLMKFPQEVIEYVIIHELAHIQHKNHSKAFWSCVESYCSNYKVLNKQLKAF